MNEQLRVLRGPLIVVGVGLLLVVLFFLLLWSPQTDRRDELGAEIDGLEDELREVEAELRRLRELEANEPLILEEIDRIYERLGRGTDLRELVDQVADAADDAGVTLLSLSVGTPDLVDPEEAPSTDEQATALASISLDMELEGNFQQVVEFQRQLTRELDRAVQTRQVSISDQTPQEFGATESLAVSWSGDVYAVVIVDADGEIVEPFGEGVELPDLRDDVPPPDPGQATLPDPDEVDDLDDDDDDGDDEDEDGEDDEDDE